MLKADPQTYATVTWYTVLSSGLAVSMIWLATI